MFSRDTISEITRTAEALGIEPAALLAVAEVESGGRAFTLIAGRREPLIRFEGHYLDRRLRGAARARARAERLAHPRPGAIRNPSAQAARWRLLDRAAAIDRGAALESVSWGIGQVMGAHWAWLGYGDVEALVAEARSGVAGQVRLMHRYIEKAALVPALRARDWPAFARGYNGPAYARNRYDSRMDAAYRRFARAQAPVQPRRMAIDDDALLARGAEGEPVRALQRALSALGYRVAIDGRFDGATEAAVRRLQRAEGLVIDGIVGPRTRAAIEQAFPARNFWRWLRGGLGRLLGAA